MSQMIEDFRNGLSALGITKGDTIYIGSDITTLMVTARKKEGIVEKKAQDAFINSLIDELQNAIGKEGTLLFPVFTWDFCKGSLFDVKKTQGSVGVLNNWVLNNRSDFQRTSHPIYSFMVWGRDTNLLVSMDNQEAWGEDSPFEYMNANHVKLVLINVPLQRAFTFMHYVEQKVEVPYRYHKYFIGRYTDKNGCTTNRCYSMYVRDMSIDSKENMTDAFMEDCGVMKGIQTDYFSLKSLDLSDVYIVVKNDLLFNGGKNCYYFTNYEIDWGKGRTHEHEISDRLS